MVWRVCLVLALGGGCEGSYCKERLIPVVESDLTLNGEPIADVLAEAEVPLEVLGTDRAGADVLVRVELVFDRTRIQAVDLERHDRRGPFPRTDIGVICLDSVRAAADYRVYSDGDLVLEGVGWALLRNTEAWAAYLSGTYLHGDAVAWVGDPPPAYEGPEEIEAEGVYFNLDQGGPAPRGEVVWDHQVKPGDHRPTRLLTWPASISEGE
jgi:hypothetical protein